MKKGDASFVASPSIFPCGTNENQQNLCQIGQPSGQDYNWQLPEYETEDYGEIIK